MHFSHFAMNCSRFKDSDSSSLTPHKGVSLTINADVQCFLTADTCESNLFILAANVRAVMTDRVVTLITRYLDNNTGRHYTALMHLIIQIQHNSNHYIGHTDCTTLVDSVV